MKKNVLTALLLVMMVCALLVSFAGCTKEAAVAGDDIVAQLKQENAQLKEQIKQLTAALETAKQGGSVQSWELTGSPWSDRSGATITCSITPANYEDGMTAALSIRMGELEAESTLCTWDGKAFTGSVELNAADGYSYYCIFTTPDGIQDEVALNSPQHPVNSDLVYLGSSLTSYANLVVEDWANDDGKLVINSGFIQVQTPLLGETVTLQKAELVFLQNGSELERMTVDVPAGEGAGSYELALSGTSFTMPEVSADCQLDLNLEAALSDGSVITSSGGSWYVSDGELVLSVG